MALKSAVIRDPVVRMEYELEQCGRWIRSGNGRSGYGACVLASLRGSTVPEPNIIDSRAEEIDAAMTNICRCGTYPRIRTAIRLAGRVIRGEERIAAALEFQNLMNL